MNEYLDLKKATIRKIDPDILVTSYKFGMSISEDDAKEIDRAHLTMSQGNEMFVIADLKEGNPQVDKDAELFFINKGQMIPFTRAVAIITNQKSSFVSRFFGNLGKALYPTKEFDDLESASDWFDSLRD